MFHFCMFMLVSETYFRILAIHQNQIQWLSLDKKRNRTIIEWHKLQSLIYKLERDKDPQICFANINWNLHRAKNFRTF